MKTIFIGFSRSSEKFPIFSWLIMAAEGVNFSHAYIKTFDESIQEYVYWQASHTMVNLMTETIFKAQEIVVEEYEFQISDEAFLKLEKFVMDNMGKPYGLLTIFGMGWIQLCSYVGIQTTNPFKEAGENWVCSEFVAAALDDLDTNNIQMDVNSATPKDMRDIVRTLPKDLNVGQ